MIACPVCGEGLTPGVRNHFCDKCKKVFNNKLLVDQIEENDMTVFTSWPLNNDWYSNQVKILKVVIEHNGKQGDSGSGMGVRDMEFHFKTKKDVKIAIAEITALNIQGLTIDS